MTDEHPIPPITDPSGEGWSQPDRLKIRIDDVFATMSNKVFEALAEYSTTIPTGVYPGKMWKARVAKDRWQLRWYGASEKPNYCSNHARLIRIQ